MAGDVVVSDPKGPQVEEVISSCSQSFPASGSFLVSQLFTSGGQSVGVSVSASILPMKTDNLFQ